MRREVVLTRDIERKLDGLTPLRQEVNGVLLYRRHGNRCGIEAMFMTGVGCEGHVQSRPERMDIVNEFFQRNPAYGFVKFHTHCKGTITRYGDYYARHFSQGDEEGMRQQLRQDERYIAMLVTPEVKLLWGKDNPRLRVVERFPNYENRSRAVTRALNVIAENLGHAPLQPLQATLVR